MNPINYEKSASIRIGASVSSRDVGLREYMVAVYKYMAIMLSLTGVVALVIASSQALQAVFFSMPIYLIAILAPLAIPFYMSARFATMSVQSVRWCALLYSGLLGISLSTVFMVYTGVSVARVFFISASSFGALTLYGYTTKKDLTGFGSFLFIGLIGILIASLVNMFMRSGAMDFVISGIGVLVFAGLTAYDTQRIKDVYYQVAGHSETQEKAAIYGAFALYMDLINLFLMLLRFFGDRRSS